jgi:hypothetical protein
MISAGSFVKDEDIPESSLVSGHSPNLKIKVQPKEKLLTVNFLEAE